MRLASSTADDQKNKGTRLSVCRSLTIEGGGDLQNARNPLIGIHDSQKLD